MAYVVADSDVLIDALQGRDPAVDRIRIGIETGTLATTAVHAFELLSGVASDRARKPVKRLLAALAILPLDAEAARIAAEVRKVLEAKGEPIGMTDYLIAGICLSRQAVFLTRNTAPFARVPALRLDPLFDA